MHLLVIRTSAMGDVALTTPVITALRKEYPDVSITLVTRPFFAPFFISEKGLKLFLVDFAGRHKGVAGLFRLYADLITRGRPDHIIDLHDVLRTRILRFLFSMSGTPIYVIDKGRSEKRHLISGRNKAKLKHTVERYCDVLAKAGFPVVPGPGSAIMPSPETIDKLKSLPFQEGVKNVGVAPYARHPLKMWPEENMIKLLRMISEKHKVKFWLFGGFDEQEQLSRMHVSLPGSYLVSVNHNLDEELALMSRLDLVISMDSSNMHMAALTGTKVISIWGGTDPLTGFGAWQQPDEYSIRIPVEELTCRPCTVYGRGKCKRGDFACMMWLTPEKVYERMVNLKIL